MSFGRMPLANAFLRAEDFADETFFELAPAFCAPCGTFQLFEQPDPAALFHGDYPFYTGSSARMSHYFSEVAEDLIRRCSCSARPGSSNDGAGTFIIELGCNDGTMLQVLAARGIPHLGVEPSGNVAQSARDKGVNVLESFFGAACATAIVGEYGQADIVYAANVMCHIPDLHRVAEAVDLVLKQEGRLIFEDPYLGDMLARTSYDQIYDEHVFMFSLAAVTSAFSPHGFTVVECQALSNHGGSMRYTLARDGIAAPAPSVAELAEKEEVEGLQRAQTFTLFAERCTASRTELRAVLGRLHDEGAAVLGYGAASKSTTVINYCGIDKQWLPAICDSTPAKQGRFSPGAHIPIVPPEVFADPYPDFALLFVWNHQEEIIAKEKGYRRHGGKWISHTPRVEVWP